MCDYVSQDDVSSSCVSEMFSSLSYGVLENDLYRYVPMTPGGAYSCLHEKKYKMTLKMQIQSLATWLELLQSR
jgi:hypothetical protein